MHDSMSYFYLVYLDLWFLKCYLPHRKLREGGNTDTYSKCSCTHGTVKYRVGDKDGDVWVSEGLLGGGI